MARNTYRQAGINSKDHPLVDKSGALPLGAGFIYIIRFGDQYKVGFTTNPRSRIPGLQCQQRRPFDDLHIIFTDNAKLAERMLHRHLIKQRIGREWFALTNEQAKDLFSVVSLWFTKNNDLTRAPAR